MPRRKPTAPSETTDDGANKAAAPDASPAANPSSAVDGLAPEPKADAPQSAFDLFVERGLHAIYDGVLAEPIPDELLRLIENDRRK